MNNKIIAAIVNSAKIEDVKHILTLFIEKLSIDGDWNNNKTNHVLELLLGASKEITTDQVNVDYIKEHLELLLYKPEKYNFKDISVDSIDNIECNIRVRFKYIEKINEDNDMEYSHSYTNISFLDNPLILK